MKTSGWLFALGALFFFSVAGAYWYIAGEIVGTVALLLTGGLGALIGFYVLFTDQRIGRLPEDRSDAEISDAEADYGFFSPHSWWPLAVASSAAVVMLGMAFAVWIIVAGVVMLLLAVAGMLFEYYRPVYRTVDDQQSH